MTKTPQPIVHLRALFWRPDILAIAQTEGKAELTLCDQVLPAARMTCDTRVITCEACRHNFTEGLITGTGERITYDQYLAQKHDTMFPTMREKAAASDWPSSPVGAAISAPHPVPGASWSSAPVKPVDGWTTGTHSQQPTKQEPAGSPVWDGWRTK